MGPFDWPDSRVYEARVPLPIVNTQNTSFAKRRGRMGEHPPYRDILLISGYLLSITYLFSVLNFFLELFSERDLLVLIVCRGLVNKRVEYSRLESVRTS